MAFEILKASHETVDRDRGYSLVQVGGQSDGTVIFELRSREGVAKVYATQSYRPFMGDEERHYPDAIEKVVGVWKPHNIRPGSPLWPILCEALTAYRTVLGEPSSLPFEVQ